MNSLSGWRLFRSLSFVVILFSIFSCRLQVEKIEDYGVNDQQFVYGPGIGNLQDDTVFRFCCNGTISTHMSEFDKGKYDVLIRAKGTPSYNVYPHILVMVNNKVLGEIRLDSNYTTYHLPFLLVEKKSIGLQILFDQDGLDDKGNDRDVLIRKITVKPADN